MLSPEFARGVKTTTLIAALTLATRFLGAGEISPVQADNAPTLTPTPTIDLPRFSPTATATETMVRVCSQAIRIYINPITGECIILPNSCTPGPTGFTRMPGDSCPTTDPTRTAVATPTMPRAYGGGGYVSRGMSQFKTPTTSVTTTLTPTFPNGIYYHR